MNSTQTTKINTSVILSKIDDISIHICNGENAYGHIVVNGEKFVLIFLKEENGVYAKIFACPYFVNNKILMNKYFSALCIQKK
jgi:hypothetical protein